MDFTSKEKLEKAEELDKLKSKVLKYVLYKKRTESEVREKFSDVDEVLLEDVIDFLKEYKNKTNQYEKILKYFDEKNEEVLLIGIKMKREKLE